MTPLSFVDVKLVDDVPVELRTVPQVPCLIMGLSFVQRRAETDNDRAVAAVLSDVEQEIAGQDDVTGKRAMQLTSYASELRAMLPAWSEALGLDVGGLWVGPTAVFYASVPASIFGARGDFRLDRVLVRPGQDVRILLRNRNAFAVDVRTALIVQYAR